MSRSRPVALFLWLFAFWSVLSYRIDPVFIVLGIGSAALVTWYAIPILTEVLGPPGTTPKVSVLPLVSYLGWLITRIPSAAIDVAMSILIPSRAPRPGVVRFTTGLYSPAARTLLANSITLVPGTMTLSVDGGEFVVHALNPRSVRDLANAETQRRIARIFNIPADEPPAMRWDPLRTELPEEP